MYLCAWIRYTYIKYRLDVENLLMHSVTVIFTIYMLYLVNRFYLCLSFSNFYCFLLQTFCLVMFFLPFYRQMYAHIPVNTDEWNIKTNASIHPPYIRLPHKLNIIFAHRKNLFWKKFLFFYFSCRFRNLTALQGRKKESPSLVLGNIQITIAAFHNIN